MVCFWLLSHQVFVFHRLFPLSGAELFFCLSVPALVHPPVHASRVSLLSDALIFPTCVSAHFSSLWVWTSRVFFVYIFMLCYCFCSFCIYILVHFTGNIFRTGPSSSVVLNQRYSESRVQLMSCTHVGLTVCPVQLSLGYFFSRVTTCSCLYVFGPADQNRSRVRARSRHVFLFVW